MLLTTSDDVADETIIKTNNAQTYFATAIDESALNSKVEEFNALFGDYDYEFVTGETIPTLAKN
ncbi:MAG: hypothetical protein R3Y38_01355 [Rikenellaceae bacterium]